MGECKQCSRPYAHVIMSLCIFCVMAEEVVMVVWPKVVVKVVAVTEMMVVVVLSAVAVMMVVVWQ